MNKLNLGCGEDIKEGFINVDKDINIFGDIYNLDINVLPLPFPDNFFDFVLMRSILEYSNDPFLLLNEIFRICKGGAVIKLVCPYYNSVICFPHKSFNRNLFKYLYNSRGQNYKFKVLDFNFIPTFWGFFIPKIPIPFYIDLQYFISCFLRNIIDKLIFRVEVLK